MFFEAVRRLGVTVEDSVVVGDSVWRTIAAARWRAIGIGLLSGGYGREDLERSRALRVHDDPADLLDPLDRLPRGHLTAT